MCTKTCTEMFITAPDWKNSESPLNEQKNTLLQWKSVWQ